MRWYFFSGTYQRKKDETSFVSEVVKSVHFKKPVTRISFLSKRLSFSLKAKLSYIENDNILKEMRFA